MQRVDEREAAQFLERRFVSDEFRSLYKPRGFRMESVATAVEPIVRGVHAILASGDPHVNVFMSVNREEKYPLPAPSSDLGATHCVALALDGYLYEAGTGLAPRWDNFGLGLTAVMVYSCPADPELNEVGLMLSRRVETPGIEAFEVFRLSRQGDYTLWTSSIACRQVPFEDVVLGYEQDFVHASAHTIRQRSMEESSSLLFPGAWHSLHGKLPDLATFLQRTGEAMTGEATEDVA
jgi:hypothetical protein